MNRNLFILLMLSLSLPIFTSCSDDEDYNPDTAISNYVPVDKPKVGEIKMSISGEDTRKHTWDYKFVYDAKDRIKQVALNFTTFVKRGNNNRIWQLDVECETNYKFVKEDVLSVAYHINHIYPDYPKWNKTPIDVGSYSGVFNSNGYLISYGPFDCEYEYNGSRLKKAYLDNGREYTLYYNTYDNITGYVCDSVDKKTEMRDIYKYEYISEHKNNTNFDFSAFIGNIVIERELPINEEWYYAPIHLGAFGMLGNPGIYLPKGDWTMENGLPVKYIHPQGFEMTIKYVE